MPTDIEIARTVTLRPIAEVAARVGVRGDAVLPYGHHIAKLDIAEPGAPRGRLILVTAISPTSAGEGKTTTSIGLADALNLTGRRAVLALREPSLGPCFGQKGGATGGGRAQVAPMEAINLHFTGDFHAVSAAHNLLAAMIDNHVYWGNALEIDLGRIGWRRALDMNDRALRGLVQGLGGRANGLPRESGFDITVASEVMAILCLADDLEDLQARLGRIVVAYSREKAPITARDLKADGAMAALLVDAFKPNLVQTLEGNPALIHGGPFANIAHGCNSLRATRLALSLGDYAVTEAGFGADLGAEKFLDIKCRQSGLAPATSVLVATARALKWHGGVARGDLGVPDVGAIERGAVNLVRHIENLHSFGLRVVVAINHFGTDTTDETAAIVRIAAAHGVTAIECRHWADGGAGAIGLADAVATLADLPARPIAFPYSDNLPLLAKIEAVATRLYRASGVEAPPRVRAQLAEWERAGFGRLPVCIAKTQYSFSADPALLAAPTGHILPIREVSLAAGAGFVVAICGDILTMPGLPRAPAAERIHLDELGRIEGLS